MANHLLIGLGGTGGKILREMRKRIFEQFSSNTDTGKTHLEYIYVDSDKKDLYDDKSWNYLGQGVNLARRQKVDIHGIGAGVLDEIQLFPGINAFINKDDLKELRSDQVSGIIDAGIGGQRRRFGRILMANNVTNNPDEGFSAVLRDRIISMTQNHDGDGTITFHICAGLAGGTGSGSIIDAIAQLHKIIAPMGNAFDVYLYLYVPEILVPERENQGFYHANGYAALTELNALALGKYHPVDISGKKDPETGKTQRLVQGGNAKPFKRAYLFSNRNEQNMVLDKEIKLPMAVADFLYQKIVASETSIGNQLRRVIESENRAVAAEKDAAGNQIHARDFISFGIIRLQYPETEIKAYASERTAEMTLTGLLSNTWIDRRGYAPQTDEDAGIGLGQEVRVPGTQEKLLLSYDYVTLQRPVANFNGTEDWKGYDEYWNTFCTFFSTDVMKEHSNYRDWVPAFDEIVDIEFDANFRGLGVNRFFNTQKEQREVKRYAGVLCKHIEKTLFNEWVNGKHGENSTMSLQKARLFLTELANATRERLPRIAKQKADLIIDRDSLQEQLRRKAEETKDTGKVSNFIWDSAKKVFLSYVKLKGQFNATKTKIEACDFAHLLLEEVIARISDMVNSILLLQNMFRLAMVDANAEAEMSCKVQTEFNAGDVEYVEKRFNPNEVRANVESEILANEELQHQIVSDILQQFKKIAEESGKPNLFRAVYDAMGGTKAKYIANKDDEEEHTESLLNFLLSNSREQLTEKIRKAGEDDETKKLIGVNILEKLRQDFPTGTQLEDYLRKTKEKAHCFLQFNATEFGKHPGGQEPSSVSSAIQICVPEYEEGFRSDFIEKIRGLYSGNVFTDNSVATNDKPNEIVIIMLKGDFPLRFIQNVSYLKEQYDSMISEHNNYNKLNRVLLHTESLPDNQLPSLFEESVANVRKRMILVGIKAHLTPGLIEQGVDPETDLPVNIINIGTRMDEENCYVGKDVLQTVEMLIKDVKLREKLAAYIDKACEEHFKGEAGHKAFVKQIEDYLFDEILPLCGGNKLSDVFKEYKEATKELIKSFS